MFGDSVESICGELVARITVALGVLKYVSRIQLADLANAREGAPRHPSQCISHHVCEAVFRVI